MIHYPTLWTAFVFNGPSQHHQAITYLERAGNLPLVLARGAIRAEHFPLMLEHVELHRTGPYHLQSGGAFPEDNYEHPPPLFGDLPVPSLRIIVLDAIHTDWQRVLVWSNLTTLNIRKLPFTRTPNGRQFQSLLRANPRLKKLLLDGAGPMWPTKPNNLNGEVGDPVVLP
ncbi:hypothetical protein CVT24_012072 [Panaeolus cyanescens]|uniref:Uncharacterized protein n=1 Tax=Panaeolus cyanescens TaxID=181874 RepID=A0A409YP73_9AGAR|nr:hypothetical protein CVT24_012072 [Panaeolus cyanescens]